MRAMGARTAALYAFSRILRRMRFNIRSFRTELLGGSGGGKTLPARRGVLPAICACLMLATSGILLFSGDVLPRQHGARIVHPFLPSSFGGAPLGSEDNSAPGRVHVAMIFDENRLNFTVSVARSLMHYAAEGVTFHFVSPVALHPRLERLAATLPGDAAVVPHDYALCSAPVSLVSYIARGIHVSAMCKVFLAEIIPADVVLYIDSDVTVVADIAHCWVRRGTGIGTDFGRDAVIGMGVDMGEACQSTPDRCYPIGMQFSIPEGLECGTTPSRAVIVRTEGRLCQEAGSLEPYQFNGGVALMNLRRMRSAKFTARFVQTSLHTWRVLGYRQAEWGEQDLLNNFFRLYPEAIVNLPCGCNFQFSAARRESKCSNRTVVIAHGWTRQLLDEKSHDPFNLHFNFFRRSDVDYRSREKEPPRIKPLTRMAPDWTPLPDSNFGGAPADVALRSHDPSCSHQSHHCAADDRLRAQEVSLEILGDTVNVLSRTSRRPLFFADMAESVSEQTHRFVRHIVGTDDDLSRALYLRGATREVVMFKRPHRVFDPTDVCKQCVSPSGVCGKAPSMEYPKERQQFLDCYCGTTYPMNEYMNQLHKKVKRGWVLYVDDDNLLQDKFVISELLASIKSRKSLIAFRSHLGRVTPSEENFAAEGVMMGDFDSSNFAFHSDYLRFANWGWRRCGDFRVARRLAAVLPTEWVNRAFIQANPMRSALGGLGRRSDRINASVTVIVTSHLAEGWRPRWVHTIVDAYTAPEMRHLISKVILVWNNVDEQVPLQLADAESSSFVILRSKKNSLNSRWIETLEHIDTDIVLNLDDDAYVDRAGLLCLINWLRRDPRRIIGPFVRRIDGNKYVLDELLDTSEYSVVLPRILLLPTSLMRAYANKAYRWYHNYIDVQGAHCDDIFLNLVAQNISEVPPLRVLLPEKSVIDFYSKCYTQNGELTGGLALQPGRAKKRSECVSEIMKKEGLGQFLSTAQVATCLPRGNALDTASTVEPSRYKAMLNHDFSCEKPRA